MRIHIHIEDMCDARLRSVVSISQGQFCLAVAAGLPRLPSQIISQKATWCEMERKELVNEQLYA